MTPVDLSTSEQLARVSALAEQTSIVARRLECLRGSRCLFSELALRCALGPLVRDLDREGRELRSSGVLQSEIVVVSLRADVEQPIARMYAELWAPRASTLDVSRLGLNSRR